MGYANEICLNRASVLQITSVTTSQPLDSKQLCSRLEDVAGEREGSRSTFSRPLAESSSLTEATPPVDAATAEASSYHELIKNGGRPVCSIEDLSKFLANPTEGYETLLPWVIDHPDFNNRDKDMKSVFSTQLRHWWDFRKSQWDNRGNNSCTEGFPAFLAACKSKYDRMGLYQMTSSASFEATIRRQWEHKPTARQVRVPDSQSFPPYRDAVRRRLARFNFSQPLHLKKDPRRQSNWGNWLEYVSYEQWWLEEQTADKDSLEDQTHMAWKKLLQARSQEPKIALYTNATSRSTASGTSQFHQGHLGTGMANFGKELEIVRAELHATHKILDDFIRETAQYRQIWVAQRHQRRRVRWAVNEARLMEAEMLQQREVAKSSTEGDVMERRKRRRTDDGEEEGVPYESWAKRTRHGGGAVIAVTKPAPSNTRRSKRLAEGKIKV